DDWPLSYAELAPYYDKVDEFVGVSGAFENIPNLPDGKSLPAMKRTCGEQLLKKAVEGRWKDRRVTIGRTAILTHKHNGRAARHYPDTGIGGGPTISYFVS